MNRNTVDAQARWARAFHRRVTGSQIRLANATPAIAAVRLDCDTPSSFSPPATAAARMTVPTTASTNRRMADQAPALRGRRLPGRNNEAEPTGAAMIAASSNVSSMPALTLHFRAVLLTSPGGSMRAGAEYGRGRTGQAVGSSAAGGGYFSPRALASSSRLMPDRPGRSRCLASSYSSARVLGAAARVLDAAVLDAAARVLEAEVLGAAARVPDAAAVLGAAARVPDAAVLGAAARVLDAAARVPDAAARVPDAAAVLGAAARVLDAAAVVFGAAAVLAAAARVLGAAARALDAAVVLAAAAPTRVRRTTAAPCWPIAATGPSGNRETVFRAAADCSAFSMTVGRTAFLALFFSAFLAVFLSAFFLSAFFSAFLSA